jgi:hypothetical protein
MISSIKSPASFFPFITSVLFLLLLAGTAAAETARLVNLSSRGMVGSGSDVLIAGFNVSGTTPKDILIRGLGPRLVQAGVTGALVDLKLQIFDSTGKALTSNDRWSTNLKSSFTQVGALPLQDNSADAALRLKLPPGSYSAQITGVSQPRGVSLIEVYEMDGTARLLNLSTRARVETGDGILISGFVVTGSGSRHLLIRAGGPVLGPLGVQGVLADPALTVLDSQGVTRAQNDNWGDGGHATELAALFKTAGAFPFEDNSKDAALTVDLPAGAYSIQVKGVGNTSGVALLEVYDLSVDAANNPSIPVVPAAAGAPGPGNPPVAEPPPVNVQAYAESALSWKSADVSARLGPTFAELNPGAADDRPTHAQRVSKMAPGFYSRINPYEVGAAPAADTDYWSDTGQVGYVPDDAINDPGLDRVQLYAYYSKVFAISPRFDTASSKTHSDLQTREPNYIQINGSAPLQPVAMVRGYGMQQNEQLTVYRDGLFGVNGMQTSRSGTERPYPGFKFPKNKIPRAIAVTTSNEFALVVVWDTDRHQGQLAVVALEGKFIPYHTWPYMGLPNQGSFSDVKLLGYIDLPLASPNSISAASNGLWAGPSSTDNRVLSQIDLSNDGYRKLIYDGAWQSVVAKNGYAIVASTEENKAVIVDLTPLFAYVRDSYLKSADSFQATMAARGPGEAQFPQTFQINPDIRPTIIWTSTVAQPTAVLAGLKLDRWSGDRFKGYIASRDGTITILDTSSLMARNSWETRADLAIIGTFQVGRNPVSMAFARRSESGLPLFPPTSAGASRAADAYNNLFYVACRGDRSVECVVTWGGQGAIVRRIQDTRLGDPVAVSTAVRGDIVTVADFLGKKILSFRVGTLIDARNNKTYGPLESGYDYEYAGQLPLAGSPFLVNSANLN